MLARLKALREGVHAVSLAQHGRVEGDEALLLPDALHLQVVKELLQNLELGSGLGGGDGLALCPIRRALVGVAATVPKTLPRLHVWTERDGR